MKPKEYEGAEETALATAVGRGRHRDFESRIKAIADLGPNLTDEERLELYEFLLRSSPVVRGTWSIGYHYENE